MRLDKSICKGAKIGDIEAVGLLLNGTYLFETTGPSHLNIYTVRIPYGVAVQATVINNDIYTIKNANQYTPVVNWGEGATESGNRILKHSYNTSGMVGQPYYKKYTIKTTCELQTERMSGVDFPGSYIKDIVSIRTDYLNGYELFAGYSGLKTIREPVLERLNTSVFNYMNAMFQDCSSLETLNLSSFNTNRVNDMSDMFNGCIALVDLNLSNFNILPQTSVGNMFRSCIALKNLYLDNCNKETIEKIINSSNFPTNKIAGETRIIHCKKENAADLQEPQNWKFIFDVEEEPEEPEVPVEPPIDPEEPSEPELPEEPEEPEIPLYEKGQFEGTDVTEVVTMVTSKYYALDNMFDGCTNLVSVNTQDWDVSNVWSMDCMFRNCSSLVSLDLGNWTPYISGWTQNMFAGCTSLQTLDMRKFCIDYLNVEEDYVVKGMFTNCTSLKNIRLDYCDAFTIDQIIRELPNNSKTVGEGTIFCKSANLRDEEKEIDNTTPPSGWKYIFTN